MSNPPRIWLDYRPVRIGWVVTDRDVVQVTAAASRNSCLWGGRFNPLLPMSDRGLSDQLIGLFGVDVLLAVSPTEKTKAFIDSYRHLYFHMWSNSIFHDRHCEFVDIRHAVKRAVRQAGAGAGSILGNIVRPVWSNDDFLAPLFAVLLGQYPEAGEITINYARGMRSALELPDKAITKDDGLSPDFLKSVTPLALTGFDLSQRRDRSGWLSPGIIFGSATDFEDLLLLWNLRAAGASVCFYDVAQAIRLRPFVEAFLDDLRESATGEANRVNFWSRAADWLPVSWEADFDVTGLQACLCRADGDGIWNGGNIRPRKPNFSAWHRDVVPSYIENEDGAAASFALPDRPFDEDDTLALNQHFVVSVDANQYGSADDLTFTTPFVPKLNEFYGRDFGSEYDKARAEPGSLGHGAVGIITSVGSQRLEIRAFRVYEWLRHFFALFGVTTERSEPGLRWTPIVRQPEPCFKV
jgi:hypothetical protein